MDTPANVAANLMVMQVCIFLCFKSLKVVGTRSDAAMRTVLILINRNSLYDCDLIHDCQLPCDSHLGNNSGDCPR